MGRAYRSSNSMRRQMVLEQANFVDLLEGLFFSIIACVGILLSSPKGMRSAMITDVQGKAVWQKVGQVPQETLESAIQEVLK